MTSTIKEHLIAAYTPGPWGVKFDEFDNAWHVTPDGLEPPTFGEWAPVCVLGAYEDNEEANARLIAAAPDLLGALLAWRNPDVSDEEANRLTAAAIAKAEGRQP